MDQATLLQWFKECNRQGAAGYRLVGVQDDPRFTAASDPTAQLIFYYDDGPQSAIDDPWP